MGTRVHRVSPSVPLLLVLLVASCGGGVPFSSQDWKSRISAGSTGSSLVGMARSLVKERTLVGKTRAEVIALLGESGKPRGTADNGLGWVVDEFPVMMSVTIFEVRFDGNGRAVEAVLREQGV